MFRTDLDEMYLFGGNKAIGRKPSYQPAVEALEERIVLKTTGLPPGTDYFQLTTNLTAAMINLAVRLQNAHLSQRGIDNLLRTDKGLRKTMAQLERANTSASLAQYFGLFHLAHQLLMQEVTALQRGHKLSETLKEELATLPASLAGLQRILPVDSLSSCMEEHLAGGWTLSWDGGGSNVYFQQNAANPNSFTGQTNLPFDISHFQIDGQLSRVDSKTFQLLFTFQVPPQVTSFGLGGLQGSADLTSTDGNTFTGTYVIGNVRSGSLTMTTWYGWPPCA